MARITCNTFIRNLRIAIFGNCNRASGRVVNTITIADKMGITIDKANRYMWFAAKYGLVTRKCGGYVI